MAKNMYSHSAQKIPYSNYVEGFSFCMTRPFKNKQQGFTMIEMIIVIVILSVLSVGSVQFISYSALGYVDTARRSELASTATIVNEKITRLVRDALPGSIRINAAQDCLEFIPVLAATRYVQAAIVGSPSTVSQQEVHAVAIDSELTQSGFLAIYPVTSDVNDLYNGSNPGIVSNEIASDEGTASIYTNAIVFEFAGSASFQFSQSSPNNRVFITGSPVAFCQLNTQLYYYRNYGFVDDISNLAAALPTTLPKRLMVADQLQANSVAFNYVPSSLRRNAIVSYELTLLKADSSDTLVVNQEVQIRNVP